MNFFNLNLVFWVRVKAKIFAFLRRLFRLTGTDDNRNQLVKDNLELRPDGVGNEIEESKGSFSNLAVLFIQEETVDLLHGVHDEIWVKVSMVGVLRFTEDISEFAEDI